jgi:hypothetical protein
MQRRQFLAHTTAVSASFALARPALAWTPSAVVLWSRALTGAIAATRTQATIAARACAMVTEAIYNAWVGYDAVAAFTLGGLARQPLAERSAAARAIAIGHAAHTVLVDLFPTQQAVFDALLASQTAGYGAVAGGANAVTVGRSAGNALLAARHHDGANQLGDLAPGAYSDTSGYAPVNTPDALVDPSRWQPLRLLGATGATVVQKFLTPHWASVRPFALGVGSAFRPPMDRRLPTQAEMAQLIDFSANLTDTTKSQVEFWAANPGTVSPPGQWMQIAEQVSAYDNATLDRDVKLFFATGQAVLDASIAAWDAKRAYDSVRPISAIRYFYRGQTIRSWGGPGQGTVTMLGEQWRPFQRATNPTPPFPEFVSGHSTFSAAAAFVLAGVRASDGINLTGTIRAGGVGFEQPTTPAQDVTFTWTSLPIAADAAGLSRRIGGIHFEQGDLAGRQLGRAVGGVVLARIRALFEGRNV